MKVIYHANCIDGFTAAWCAWRRYGDTAEYIPAQYGEEPPDVTGSEVLIVDFSYPRETLLEMVTGSKTLRVLDHHKTAEADLAGLDFCTFDMSRSGAGLAWDELHGGPRPQLVAFVEDRDLWRWRLPDSKEVSAYIGSWERTFERWEMLRELLDDERETAVSQGSAILRALDAYVDHLRDKWRLCKLGGYEVPVINTTHAVSELVGKIAEVSGAKFAVGWFESGEGDFVYSLRSRGDFDVSTVAKLYGGGGHKNAAGFTSGVLVHR
jgi:oligoribonuclease NrnB/cAMP/cGMP phosphodiesterase (DHH superfamily)